MKENIFQYTDYRQFLQDYYDDQKKKKPAFSHRYFARLAGINTSAYLKLVIDGKRNLSPPTVQKFVKAIKFNKKEAEYFDNLVFFNQAKTDKTKDTYFQRLMMLKPKVKLKGLKQDQYEYYTREYYVIIRELVSLPSFVEDTEWIANTINLPLNAKQVERAIDVLLRLGLLKRDGSGKLCHSNFTVSTPPEVHSLEILNFQRSMLNMAKNILTTVPSNLRDMRSMTIPVPIESIEEIKQRIQDFQQDVANIINKGTHNFGSVFQLNIQLFPTTKISKDQGK
jgi:uncharacterized protein (TIGR02147 family)